MLTFTIEISKASSQMVTILIRILFLFFASIATIINFRNGNDFGAVIFLLLILFTVYDYFRSGTIWISFRYIRKGNFVAAEKHIKHTKKFKWLKPAHHASYHTVLGYISLHKNELKTAAEEFEKSLEIGLKHTQDRLMAQINLASIYHRLKKPDAAKKALEEAKNYKVPGFDKEIKELSKKIL
jgi:predicted negative regulator of RcsB-dependent stress response